MKSKKPTNEGKTRVTIQFNSVDEANAFLAYWRDLGISDWKMIRETYLLKPIDNISATLT